MSDTIKTTQTLVNILESIGIPLAMLGYMYITINANAQIVVWDADSKIEINSEKNDWESKTGTSTILGKLKFVDMDVLASSWKTLKVKVKN